MATDASAWPVAPVPELVRPETALETVGETDVPAAPSALDAGARHATLALRWTVLIAGAVWAFHSTLWSLCTQTYNGDPLAYLLLVPYWVALLAMSTHLRRGKELDIHDRQVDWIVAIGVLVLMAMVGRLLVPRLGPTAGLVRADVYCLLLFLLAGCVLLFGARTVGRYWTAWLFAFACWPLLYQMAGSMLGGTVRAYSLLNVALTAGVTGLAAGGRLRKRALVAAAALGMGIVLILLVTPLPATVTELLPAAAAPVVPLAMTLPQQAQARPKETASRRPVSPVGKPLAGMVFISVVAVVLGLTSPMVPAAVQPSTLPLTTARWAPTSGSPVGYALTRNQSYGWTSRYFGLGSTWRRDTYLPRTGGPATVVDSLSTDQTGPLSVYPAVSCYRLASPYIDADRTVPLGRGVQAQLFYANLSTAATPTDAAWIMLTWTWHVQAKGVSSFQRVTVLTLDGATSRRGIPAPAAPFSSGTVRTTFTDVLRGVQTSDNTQPFHSTLTRLQRFATAIVRSRRHR